MKNVVLLILICAFAVFGSVTVITPNGGETITRGTQYEITWTDDIPEDVKIELYQNGVYNSDIITATPSDGSYLWNLDSGLLGPNFQVKVASSIMPALHTDMSDGMFTIEREEGIINVLTPNGGESFERSSGHEITWTDNIPEAVKIELFENDVFHSSISDSTESDGTYKWFIPSDIYGSNFKIAVTSALIDSLIGISEGEFAIKKGSISIMYPLEGEIIEIQENFPIEWTDDIPENVLLSLYKNTTLISSFKTPSVGFCKWSNYLTNLEPGNDYKIKLESTVYNDVLFETGFFNVIGTPVYGTLSGVWSVPNSPYFLTDSCYVESGNILIIEPGVKVVSAIPEVFFNIEGKVDAIGAFDNKIILENINLDFNSTDPDTSKIISCDIEMVKNNIVFEKTPNSGRGYSLKQTSDCGYIITGEKDEDVLLLKTDLNGNELWSKTYGGSGEDRGCSVQETQDGGFIISGYTKSYGSGGSDVWLIKTDNEGNKEWDKTFGGISDDYGYSIILASNDGYILTGSTKSYGSGYSDVWLIKTDSKGNEEWNKTFGGTDYDYGSSIQNTSDGGCIVTGTIDLEVCLIKIDINGNQEWSKSYSSLGNYFDSGNSVQQTSDGGYIISCTKDPNGANQYVWLLQTDSLGNVVWKKEYESGKYYSGASVSQTRDGGFIMGCHHYMGSFATLLIKTDTGGNEEWSKHYNYADINSYQLLLSVIQSNDCGYVFTGYVNDNLLLTKTDQYGNVKYDDLAIAINDNSNVILQNNIIHNLQNYGLTVNNATPVVSNNLITGNIGGIKFINSSPQYIVNNTIADNDSIGLYFDGNSDGQFVNNIVYGNKIKEVYIKNDLADPSFFYNDIKDGQAGFGLNSGVTYSGSYANNINLNPLFLSGSYLITDSSPCFDSGYPGLTEELLGSLYIPQNDLSGNTRLYYNEIDMGCYECVTSGIGNENSIGKLELYQNYPNPFNPVTTIKYSIPNNSKVKLNVFDITGRELCTLVDQAQNKGYHEVKFNGDRLPSGIYFYRLSIDNKVVLNKKMMLMK